MKLGASYASLLRGVSQQPPEVRQAGQHTEQVNMIPDPIEGLTRRQGTVYEKHLSIATPLPAIVAQVIKDAKDYRVHSHSTGGKDYMVLIRQYSANTTASVPPITGSPLKSIIVYNLTDKVFVPLNGDAETTDSVQYLDWYGLSAITSVGKFMVYANKSDQGAITASGLSVGVNTGGRPVIWIRGGAYTRTYRVIIGGSSVSFTTPNAGVAGAAEAISPENIAETLKVGIAGLAGHSPVRVGSHVYLGGSIGLEISTTDGGDGSLMKGIGNVVDSVDDLTLMAYHGTIVQIGTNRDNCFYMKADVKDINTTLFGECVWRECALQPTRPADPTDFYSFKMIAIEGGTVRLGRPAHIASAQNPPQIVVPAAGNANNNPPPKFMLMDNKVTYLGMFQDRLLVGSGAALAVSCAGDYFNFFRTTVLTVPISDAFEMVSQGNEDDTLRHGVPYNKNLVIFGDKKQYVISGSTNLSPVSANMSVMTTYANAADVPPVAAGGQLYYGRTSEGFVGVHQIQPGAYVDSAESFPATAQVGKYITARATQIEQAPGVPATIMVRSNGQDRKLGVFHYIDQPDGRKQDAWGTWEWDAACGTLMGIQTVTDGVVMMWLRQSGANWYLVADRLPLRAGLNTSPYFDSNRAYSLVGSTEVAGNTAAWDVAYDSGSIRFLLGTNLPDVADLTTAYPTETARLRVGTPFTSSVTLTNPYQRDGAGKAILSGRTVITRLLCSLKQTSGMLATITSGNASQDYSFNGRVLGNLLDRIGRVPISDESHSISVGRETREYTCRIASKLWYPITLVGIEWIGQAYNRTPRASQ